jgi:hypothetical protein
VPAHGGTSIVTAMVMEPAGTLVPDGTVVQFFTNLGTIDPQGKTNDGVARVNFVSDARSGTAQITACSGAAGAPGGAATPASSPSTTTTTANSGTGCANGSITVGAAAVVRLVITANPSRILPSSATRQSQIVATAFDTNGDPVPNVPVIFTAQELGTGAGQDPAKFETMGSAGNPVFTDNNGRAYDTLNTRYGTTLATRLVGVTATLSVGGSTLTASVSVQIN